MDLLAAAHLPRGAGLVIGLAIALVALELSRRNRIGVRRLVFASGVGFAVALGWVLTYALANVAFEPVQIESATFTGPSAHTLMFFLDRDAVLEFDVGLVPGVFLGAFLAAAWARELKVQGFDGPTPLRNAMIGAALMGFGGMLALDLAGGEPAARAFCAATEVFSLGESLGGGWRVAVRSRLVQPPRAALWVDPLHQRVLLPCGQGGYGLQLVGVPEEHDPACTIQGRHGVAGQTLTSLIDHELIKEVARQGPGRSDGEQGAAGYREERREKIPLALVFEMALPPGSSLGRGP